jgi:hypothetical protein
VAVHAAAGRRGNVADGAVVPPDPVGQTGPGSLLGDGDPATTVRVAVRSVGGAVARAGASVRDHPSATVVDRRDGTPGSSGNDAAALESSGDGTGPEGASVTRSGSSTVGTVVPRVGPRSGAGSTVPASTRRSGAVESAAPVDEATRRDDIGSVRVGTVRVRTTGDSAGGRWRNVADGAVADRVAGVGPDAPSTGDSPVR